MNMQRTARRDFLKAAGAAAVVGVLPRVAKPARPAGGPQAAETKNRPNILFAFADDWNWPHSHGVEDPVIKMPTYDRLCREGVRFTQAYVSAPSCTPSRGAILTGQYHWRLEQGGNLWSTLPAKFPVYPDLLEKAGYHVGTMRKSWGPGSNGDRKRNPAGDRYRNFDEFLAKRPKGAPFCFWFGTSDPHRGYRLGSGKASGMDPGKVKLPGCFPESEEIRSDVCDYYWEVQRFDRETGAVLKKLEEMGELDNTLVIMSGDNGMPFPRCKSNLYDMGTRAPLAVRWPAKVKGGRVIDDFVSLSDLAPTFLELAGVKPLACMTARSFVDVITSGKAGRVDPKRDHVLTGKERHTPAQLDTMEGYPCRAIRTHGYLYIRNFKPDLWPAGKGEKFWDIDGSPTKSYMMKHRDDAGAKKLFELAFGKRPAEELFDCEKDPHQLNNVADEPKYAAIKKKLADQLMAELKDTKDPRALGKGDVFDTYPYLGGGVKKRPPKKKKNS